MPCLPSPHSAPRGAQWVLSSHWTSTPTALSLPLQKEKLSAQASLKRHTSLNDLSLTRDEQEIEFLRLQVLEQQHVIDDLSLVRCSRRQPSGRCPGTRVSGMASGLPYDAAEAGWASPTSPR